MMLFWILAALLLLAGYSFFMPFLWGKGRRAKVDPHRFNLAIYQQRRRELEQEYRLEKIDPSEFERLCRELDRELLDELPSKPAHPASKSPTEGRRAIIIALLLLPLAAFALYGEFGRGDLLAGNAQVAALAPMPEDVKESIQKLADRLRQQPDDLEGWLLLARSYQAVDQPSQAALAFQRALQLAPENLDIKAQYAQLLAQTNNNRLAGKPTELIEEILAREPQHPFALWLAGLAAAQRGEGGQAAQYWNRLLAQMPEESQAADQLRGFIEQLRADSGQADTMAGQESPQDTAAPTGSPGASVQVLVTLSDRLADQISPQDTVFVFARAAEGPRMPLAIVRKQAKDLPLRVVLDDSMAMMPEMKLSAFPRIVLGARVSKTGNATPSPGDLEGSSEPLLAKNDKIYRIEINQVH